MVVYCCVPSCKSISNEVKMHLLPKDGQMFQKWCLAIARPDLLNVGIKRKSYKICDLHFAEDAKIPVVRNRSNLKVGAVPTLNLPAYISVASGTPPVEKNEIMSESSKRNLEECHDNFPHLDLTHPLSGIPSSSIQSPGSLEIFNRSDVKNKTSFLKAIGLRRVKELTPRSAKLYRIANNLKKCVRRLNLENANIKRRLKEAIKFTESEDFFRTKVNKTSMNFILSQMKLQRNKPRGRRFSMEDKIFALSLLKQSPKGYRLLNRTFALPSRKTLMALLNKIPFISGINEAILHSLKQNVENMDPMDRYCSLIFDEMSLEASLQYCKKTDTVDGFEDCGNGKRLKFADHAMVFMIRGLKRKWKQPIAYFFTEAGMGVIDLVRNIKLIVRSLLKIGLNVLMTVCDQHPVNVRAIKMLKEETMRLEIIGKTKNNILGFSVDGNEIIPIFDPPHLLKGIRNSFLSHNVKFTWKNGVQEASWSDVVNLYEKDIGDHHSRMMYKLTDGHIYKEKLKKMKVKIAAQVFSHTVSATLRWTALHGREELSRTAIGTADFLSFMDQLFDAVNGSSEKSVDGKLLRAAVTKESPHFQFWTEAILTLESMQFITPKGNVVPPSIKNWIVTLKGLKHIWKKLEAANLRYFCPRQANQDPLENFFGNIRSHGVRNINPTCSQFVASFKSLIVNNFTSTYSPGANCEEDGCTALDTMKNFLNYKAPQMLGVPLDTSVNDFEFKKIDFYVINIHAYIAGYISRKLLKYIGNCAICRHKLIYENSLPEHSYIEVKNYKPNALISTPSNFRNTFSKMIQICNMYIAKYCMSDDISKHLTKIIENVIKDPFECSEHDVFKIYIKTFLMYYIFTYFKNINLILKGLYSTSINDNLKKIAFARYEKYKKKKLKMQQMKMLI